MRPLHYGEHFWRDARPRTDWAVVAAWAFALTIGVVVWLFAIYGMVKAFG